MKRKILAIVMIAVMAASLASCGAYTPGGEDAGFTVGICQLIQHPALDAATQGFKDALKDKLGDKVEFIEQNASGELSNATTICGTFVSDEVDLIMANATGALQGAAAATGTIPVLGTSISDYATALEIDNWTGKTGINISGTSDLAPLDRQAELLKELFPEAKKVAILYCSGESNSVFQADMISGYFEELGMEVERFTYADSNDLAAVTQTACDAADVIYIPTDNTAATYSETINNVASFAKVPIITGDEGTCAGCGVATLSISYYDIGYITGEMAYDILVNKADIRNMEVRFAPAVTKKYNKALAALYGLEMPSDYEPIE